MDRRSFLGAAGMGGAGLAWFGGADVVLRDERWTPNRSFWAARGSTLPAPALHGEARADVAVIGGGVTGLSTVLRWWRPSSRVWLWETFHAARRGRSDRLSVALGALGAVLGFVPFLATEWVWVI